MAEWNAGQYEKFEAERTIPSRDLVNAVVAVKAMAAVHSALDVGCGTGNSTQVLATAFPQAHVVGVDNSDDMLLAAHKKYPALEFTKADVPEGLRGLEQKFDVVFSNACLQWIPDHATLLPQLMEMLNDGGVLAVQVPVQTKQLMHRILRKVAARPRWEEKLSGAHQSNLLSEEEYFDILSAASSDFRLWETTYLHAMPGHQSLVEWFKGAGMRPYLERLSDAEQRAFEADVLAEVEKSYPLQKNGEVLFRFPRLFFTARK